MNTTDVVVMGVAVSLAASCGNISDGGAANDPGDISSIKVAKVV